MVQQKVYWVAAVTVVAFAVSGLVLGGFVGMVAEAGNFKGRLLGGTSVGDNEMWHVWKGQNKRAYSTDAEESYRRSVFLENKANVLAVNGEQGSYQLELNKFSDLTESEFKAQFLSRKGFQPRGTAKHLLTDSPSSVDWRSQNAVSGVKDQGQCGACWAFSTTGAIEGQNSIKTGNLKSFSEQNLMDCSHNGENAACEGGFMDDAFTWLESHGLTLETNYPYTAKDGKVCETKPNNLDIQVKGFYDVPLNDNDQLVKAIAQAPVSVGVQSIRIMAYKGGVYDNWFCGTDLDHAVLAVGYGVDKASGKMYWLVKNSWGADWGESGYIRLERKTGKGVGICGITMSASYPTV